MEQLLQILSEIRPDVDFTKQQALIDDHVLDSFDVVSIVTEVNEAFGIEIGADELLPENFNTPAAMMKLIERMQEM